MLFGLLNDPYVSRLEAENKQMRKELTEIRRKELRKVLLSPYQQQHLQSGLGFILDNSNK